MKRKAVVIASLVVVVVVVFFFAPLVTLPLAIALQPTECANCLASIYYGISVSRTVSPSFVLLGFGGVYYQGHVGLTKPFFYSAAYSYRFTLNSSDLIQYTGGLF